MGQAVTIYVGTSGWQYKDWRPAFYPPKLPLRTWLSYFAERFQVVEVNNSFYQLPTHETVRRWAEATPPDFLFAMKMTRYVTHIKRLKDPKEPVERFVDVATELGPKLGPVLLQLPPSLQRDLPSLGATLEAFPPSIRVAVEFRHDSWYGRETQQMLSEHHAALCIADRKGHVRPPMDQTTEWGYVRLHEGTAWPNPCYGDAALQAWADRIMDRWGGDGDAYVFFNNDAHACAVQDARLLAAMLAERGVVVSRFPAADEVHIAA